MKIIEVDDPVKIILAKQEVETILINEKQIEEPFQLQDFIKYLNLQNCIYIKEDNVIPFRIFNDMLFIIGNKDIINTVNENLNEINYDLSKLSEITMDEVYQGKLEKYDQYFIINSKYMVTKK